MTLNSTQRKTLKSKAHTLKPKLKIGKGGLSDEIINILNKLLSDLSLIKIKFLGDKKNRQQLIEKIQELKIGEVVGNVGNSIILYKKNKLNLLHAEPSVEEQHLADDLNSE